MPFLFLVQTRDYADFEIWPRKKRLQMQAEEAGSPEIVLASGGFTQCEKHRKTGQSQQPSLYRYENKKGYSDGCWMIPTAIMFDRRGPNRASRLR